MRSGAVTVPSPTAVTGRSHSPGNKISRLLAGLTSSSGSYCNFTASTNIENTMPQVRNPILPGFNPDPSILRVGEDYYIATSTFEWYPGVQIHHSRDLANWELLVRPLNRKSQLDMRGNPDSCGIWAPCLTHDGSKFWLVS